MLTTRRRFLTTTAALAAAGAVPYYTSSARAAGTSKNDRLVFGLIGCGGKMRDLSTAAVQLGDIAAVCDVYRAAAERMAGDKRLTANASRKIDIYDDYRKLLERNDIDAVICATPDHWHTLIYAIALRAGKHVYGEKPMTLTVDEGKYLSKFVRSAGRVFQVGNQQRSCPWFRQAVAIAQSGMLGGPLTIICDLGRGEAGGPFQPTDPPQGLNWDSWLGQAPQTPFINERFTKWRLWLEYSGGKLTDWGAHHIDIAQWALGALGTGPVEIEGKGTFSKEPNCFSVASTFDCTLTFAGGNKIVVRDGKDNGILIEGDKEHIYVNRGKLTGNLINKIAADKTATERVVAAAAALYNGPYGAPDPHEIGVGAGWGDVKLNHMANFVRCVREGGQPISDVDTVHRGTTSCHLSNIAMLLGRKLRWDPVNEAFLDDAAANALLDRPRRDGWELPPVA